MKLNSNQNLIVVALGAFLGGVVCAIIASLMWQYFEPASKPKALRESDIPTSHTGYKFIDPLIGLSGADSPPKYGGIKNQVAAYVESQKASGLIIASVNFRDINESGGFVLNPKELYTPASLNKVPEMMAYYKISETVDPTIFSHQIEYPVSMGDHNSVQEISSAVRLVPGNTYTVRQLVEHMIRYSDNNAADLLYAYLKDTNHLDVYQGIFSDLGIDPKVLTTYADTLTIQKYSIFLRVLYNATYLDRENSESALTLLSETDFSEGIESGVPNNTLVSEKFGEVRMVDVNGALIGKEVNNCGIVYYPEHPYLLCIMTKGEGDNVKNLEAVIGSISRIIYKGMQTLYP
jgi:beta-lactamase class A